MPALQDPEIKELAQAIADGRITTNTDVGYRAVCDAVPSIHKKCSRSNDYRDKFIAWWSKYKKKANQKEFLAALDDTNELPLDPDPPVPPLRPSTLPDPVATGDSASHFAAKSADEPPKKKPPKSRAKNRPVPQPAPSPTHEGTSTNQCQFADSIWNLETTETTKPAAKPTATKKPDPKTTAKPTTAKKPDPKVTIPSTIMESMTPEQKVEAMRKAQALASQRFQLTHGGEHGCEFHEIPWVGPDGSIFTHYLVKNGHRAAMLPGGREIEVTFIKSQMIAGIMAELEHRFDHLLTNNYIREHFECFKKGFKELMQTKNKSDTVSVVCLLSVTVLSV